MSPQALLRRPVSMAAKRGVKDREGGAGQVFGSRPRLEHGCAVTARSDQISTLQVPPPPAASSPRSSAPPQHPQSLEEGGEPHIALALRAPALGGVRVAIAAVPTAAAVSIAGAPALLAALLVLLVLRTRAGAGAGAGAASRTPPPPSPPLLLLSTVPIRVGRPPEAGGGGYLSRLGVLPVLLLLRFLLLVLVAVLPFPWESGMPGEHGLMPVAGGSGPGPGVEGGGGGRGGAHVSLRTPCPAGPRGSARGKAWHRDRHPAAFGTPLRVT